jgi:hypothetical protein
MFLPHIVLNGKQSIESIFQQITPVFIRNEATILKTAQVYIDTSKKDILIESLAIEDSKKTQFLALISGRDDGLVVRLYPTFEIEKTAGVKKILVELAKQIMDSFPEFTLGETNLGEYLASNSSK